MTAVDDRQDERTTADLLLEWDQQRPRTRQRELGWSDIGGCRRRAGYRLAGVEPSDTGGSVQAVMGTAIHEAVQQRLNETAQSDDLVELAVEFGGILGHLDRYESATRTVVDVKTTTERWLDKIKLNGPTEPNLWQINGYGAALVMQGHRVEWLVLDYIARDTGEVWRWRGRPDPAKVREALAWVAAVRSTRLDMLPRDHTPDGPFCGHCPFRTVCWDGHVVGRDPRSVLYVEDPDAERWVTQLKDARAAKKAAEAAEKEAVGALDALRPNTFGRSDPVAVDGHAECLQWTFSTRQNLDGDKVRAEYRAAGAEPPIKPSTSKRLDFVIPDDKR